MGMPHLAVSAQHTAGSPLCRTMAPDDAHKGVADHPEPAPSLPAMVATAPAHEIEVSSQGMPSARQTRRRRVVAEWLFQRVRMTIIHNLHQGEHLVRAEARGSNVNRLRAPT